MSLKPQRPCHSEGMARSIFDLADGADWERFDYSTISSRITDGCVDRSRHGPCRNDRLEGWRRPSVLKTPVFPILRPSDTRPIHLTQVIYAAVGMPFSSFNRLPTCARTME